MTNRVQDLCEYIRAHSDTPLTLRELSARSGMSPYHLQRTFKAAVGVSPKEFQTNCRLQAVKAQLRGGSSVTDAIYGAGFNSSSRLYERIDTRLGMVPSEYRAGGRGVKISYVAVGSPVGRVMMGATDRGVCFVQFADSDAELLELLKKEYPLAELEPMRQPYSVHFKVWMDLLAKHLEGEQPGLDLPLDIRATAFQLRVWKFLQSIPYGKVYSYSEIARELGEPKSARAVAGACAKNRVAIAIPCHRVIRGDGTLGGYRWGIERKRALLDRERATA